MVEKIKIYATEAEYNFMKAEALRLGLSIEDYIKKAALNIDIKKSRKKNSHAVQAL